MKPGEQRETDLKNHFEGVLLLNETKLDSLN